MRPTATDHLSTIHTSTVDRKGRRPGDKTFQVIAASRCRSTLETVPSRGTCEAAFDKTVGGRAHTHPDRPGPDAVEAARAALIRRRDGPSRHTHSLGRRGHNRTIVAFWSSEPAADGNDLVAETSRARGGSRKAPQTAAVPRRPGQLLIEERGSYGRARRRRRRRRWILGLTLAVKPAVGPSGRPSRKGNWLVEGPGCPEKDNFQRVGLEIHRTGRWVTANEIGACRTADTLLVSGPTDRAGLSVAMSEATPATRRQSEGNDLGEVLVDPAFVLIRWRGDDHRLVPRSDQ
jgi:hypothetical protein